MIKGMTGQEEFTLPDASNIRCLSTTLKNVQKASKIHEIKEIKPER